MSKRDLKHFSKSDLPGFAGGDKDKDKDIDKSGSENTILFWKKLKKRDGNSRRSSDGMPEVVTMSYELFVKLLNK